MRRGPYSSVIILDDDYLLLRIISIIINFATTLHKKTFFKQQKTFKAVEGVRARPLISFHDKANPRLHLLLLAFARDHPLFHRHHLDETS